jgi:hypothetical protein
MAGAMGEPRDTGSDSASRLGSKIPDPDRQASAAKPIPLVLPLPDTELEGRRQLFASIFSQCSSEVAKKASRAERESASLLEVRSLTYGEMDLKSLHEILNTVKRDHGVFDSGRGVFLDLGSGAGKAVIAAGLLHPFERVVGIERLECLSQFAVAANERYQEVKIPGADLKPEAQFITGDFVELLEEQQLQELAPEVRICLAVATCYTEDQMQALARYARTMPSDAFVITFTQPLPASFVNNEAHGWVLVDSQEMQMMWGQSTRYIYKKVPVTEAAGPSM